MHNISNKDQLDLTLKKKECESSFKLQNLAQDNPIYLIDTAMPVSDGTLTK